MVYTIALTNPLACGHDGTWKLDLLMECVVGTLPEESPSSPTENGGPLAQSCSQEDLGANASVGVGVDSSGGGGGGDSGDPVGGSVGRSGSSGEEATVANSTSKTPQQPSHPPVDFGEVDDISEDEDYSESEENDVNNTNVPQQQQQRKGDEVLASDSVVAQGEAADGVNSSVGEDQDWMDISDDDEEDDGGVGDDSDDVAMPELCGASVNGVQPSSETVNSGSETPATTAKSPAAAAVVTGQVGDGTGADNYRVVDKKSGGAKATEVVEGKESGSGAKVTEEEEGKKSDGGATAKATEGEEVKKSDVLARSKAAEEEETNKLDGWAKAKATKEDKGIKSDDWAKANVKATEEDEENISDLSSLRPGGGEAGNDAVEISQNAGTPAPARAPAQATTPATTQVSTSASTPITATTQATASVPAPAPAPAPTPAPTLAPAPAPAPAEEARLLKENKQQEVVPCLSSSENDSSEGETITKAVALRRKQAVPMAMPAPGLDRPLNGVSEGRLPLPSTPSPSPPESSGRSSIGSLISTESVMKTGEDSRFGSDSSFDGSDEGSWGSSEGESDDDDSDDYAPDVVPPVCSMIHRERRTYKNALCKECYENYVRGWFVTLDILSSACFCGDGRPLGSFGCLWSPNPDYNVL